YRWLREVYIILQCSSCGNILIARKGQKTKLCTYCNTRLNLHKVRLLAEALNSREASRIAMNIKDRYKSVP
ncbi:MAG: DUF1922 domain-containing protein, partial [Candidatus Bathyarchaeia archaeon]